MTEIPAKDRTRTTLWPRMQSCGILWDDCNGLYFDCLVDEHQSFWKRLRKGERVIPDKNLQCWRSLLDFYQSILVDLCLSRQSRRWYIVLYVEMQPGPRILPQGRSPIRRDFGHRDRTLSASQGSPQNLASRSTNLKISSVAWNSKRDCFTGQICRRTPEVQIRPCELGLICKQGSGGAAPGSSS